MIGSVITWFAVPVPSFVHKGLGIHNTAARAPPLAENTTVKATSGPQSQDKQRPESLLDRSARDSGSTGRPPSRSVMSKSRSSSRRQSNAGGELKRVSLDNVQEENAERHVKFNIDFDEWRRNTQTNLVSADTTFTSGLRRIRSSQVSLASLLDGQSTTLQSPAQLSSHSPLSAQHSMVTSTEDLTKFPSESLHSFSFSQPRDPTAILESRQSILRKSIDFMKDKLHGVGPSPLWADPSLTASPVDVHPKDQDVLQSLRRDHLIPEYWDETDLSPPTAPLSIVVDPFDSVDFEPLMMPRRKRSTQTDLSGYKLQAKIFDAFTKPYSLNSSVPLPVTPSLSPIDRRLSMHLMTSQLPGGAVSGVVPVHATTRLAPTMQAIFSTEAIEPWKILNANDLACLGFGVGEQEIKRGVSILEFFEYSRREWLQERLKGNAATDASSLDNSETTKNEETVEEEPRNRDEAKERVVLCGEVISMRKMRDENASKSSPMAASIWVKEKKGAFIWVVELISNAVATVSINPKTEVVISSDGQVTAIFGQEIDNLSVSDILPFLDRDDKGILEWQRIAWKARYCANFEYGSEGQGWVPCTIEVLKTYIPTTDEDGRVDLRVSYLPHIAGVLVLDTKNLTITSSNSAFSSALFGRRNLCGLEIGEVLPNFRRLVHFLAKEQKAQKSRRNSVTAGAILPVIDVTVEKGIKDDYILDEGTVVAEHAFRRAEAILELRQAAGADMTPSTSSSGSSVSTESDESELVGTFGLGESEQDTPVNEVIDESSDNSDTPSSTPGFNIGESLLSGGLLIKPHGLRGVHRDGGEVVVDVQMRVVRPTSESPGEDNIYYALWITYSGPRLDIPPLTPLPPVEPGAAPFVRTTKDKYSSDEEIAPDEPRRRRSSVTTERAGIDAWEIVEEMGEGAYGSVKLVRHRHHPDKTAIMKYVTKARILVDTWTRDRELGTVPLEIHILSFLRKRPHRNLCEMVSFFEDEKHYYVEMTPFGRPGTDLFDWIELHTAMSEAELKSIFHQTCSAIEHLHTSCGIVHRDIKDENVVLDNGGRVKVIDFGSAAYLKDGPFDTFHGTLDYASPEVLSGKKYEGPGQDVWAAGILLYTMIYKENPFYNIDEILDRDLRIPFIMSDESIALIRQMLERNLSSRPTMAEVLKHPWFNDVIELDWTDIH